MDINHNTIEYLMERRAEAFKSDPGFVFEQSYYEAEGVTIRILKNTVPFGSFSLLPYSNGDVYFYAFELFPENRGHGMGTKIFPYILNYIYCQGYRNILLQVSSSNPAALALYRHYGFSVKESVTLQA